VDVTSNAYLYSQLGIGIDSLRRRLDGDMCERLQCALLKPTARTYRENYIVTREAREISLRESAEGEPEEESTARLERAEVRRGRAEKAQQRAGTARLAHDVAHIMRLENGEAKGCGWKPDVATPWDGSTVPKRFKGRRAGLVDTILGQLDMGLEKSGGAPLADTT